MEPKQLIQEAQRKLAVADHFMHVTFPMIKETKMLKAIMDHLANSVFMAMEAVLEHEKREKKLFAATGNFQNDVELFRRVGMRYGFSGKYTYLLQELHAFQESKKKSHMEFVRGGKYVFAFDDYSMKSLTEERVKKTVAFAKEFILKAGGVVG